MQRLSPISPSPPSPLPLTLRVLHRCVSTFLFSPSFSPFLFFFLVSFFYLFLWPSQPRCQVSSSLRTRNVNKKRRRTSESKGGVPLHVSSDSNLPNLVSFGKRKKKENKIKLKFPENKITLRRLWSDALDRYRSTFVRYSRLSVFPHFFFFFFSIFLLSLPLSFFLITIARNVLFVATMHNGARAAHVCLFERRNLLIGNAITGRALLLRALFPTAKDLHASFLLGACIWEGEG